jgi:hypothetical protein
MKTYRLFIFLAIIVILLSCRSETAPFKPQQIEQITDDKEFIRIMLKRSLTRIEDGNFMALIEQNLIGQFSLVATSTITPELSEQCRANSDCIGVVYASVSQNSDEQSQIMYRIYPRGQSLTLDCTWVETYDLNFSDMSEKIMMQMKGRAIKWIETCFANQN